jgi:hypothetical protein
MATRKTATKKEETTEIPILEVQTQTIEFYIRGTSPLLYNRVTEKAWRELLLPAPKKNRGERASTLKHNPLEEFRASAYKSPTGPTYLVIPKLNFKAAARNAALDIPGAFKTQIGRLTYVEDGYFPIYGMPYIHMGIVRMADTNRTPDVRTRAILPRWATKIALTIVRPRLTDRGLANLVGMSGVTNGIGDWRQEKGSGSYGQFRIVNADDEEWHAIVATGGRDAQVEAMRDPTAYNEETEELLAWYDVEVRRRGLHVVPKPEGETAA